MKKVSKAPWMLLGAGAISATVTMGTLVVDEMMPEVVEPEPIVIEKIVEVEVPVPIEAEPEVETNKLVIPKIRK